MFIQERKQTRTIKNIALCCFIVFPGLSNSNHFATFKPEKWKQLKNIEQIEYCLSLPLNGFWEDNKKNREKAKHVFIGKSKSKTMLTVSGLLRSENKTTIEYYDAYFDEERNPGKAIEKRKLDATANKFYSVGYWSNAYYNTRFIEMLWLRKDELVKLEINFPVKDTAAWYPRLEKLFKQTSSCGTE
jgi:hypothetical protein